MMFKILVTLFCTFAVSNGQECHLPGGCVNSPLVAADSADNYDSCLSNCQKNQNCSWFTFEPFENFCELFEACNELTEEHCKQCQSGESTCKSTQCGISGQCQGDYLFSEKIIYETDCLRLCQTEENCTWYSFSKDLSECILFSTCSKVDQNQVKFSSGESTCTLLAKILVATGDPASRHSEVIDLVDPTLTCEDFGTYPGGNVYGAVGGLIQEDLPFICGGANVKECYVIGQEGVSTTLLERRYFAASIVIENGQTLFVTGGETESGSYSQTTELIRPGEVSMPGPELPLGVQQHCLLKTDENTLILIGGYTGSYSQNVYFFDLTNLSWTAGPGLSMGRREHACGLFNNPMSEGQLTVIVAGGFDGNYLKSVVLLNLKTLIWEEGPDLPVSLSGGQMVSSPHMEGVIHMGGYDGGSQYSTMYELQCTTIECQWITMEQKLADARRLAVAMYVPDIVQPSCEKK